MSSIFSDPPFPRGRTLASGDFGDAISDPATVGVFGSGVVGSIKAFQDVAVRDFTTGATANPAGSILSNRLVYCQAVRYTGTTVEDVTTIAGTAFVVDLALENGRAFAQISEAATDTHVGAGREFGVVDEYLTGRLVKNDVIWIVRKGPVSIKQAAATSISSGAQVEVTGSAGKIQAKAGSNPIGITVLGAATAATANTNVRVNLVCDDI